MENFGERLKFVRKSKEISQKELANRVKEEFGLQITVNTISNYETNVREPNLRTLRFLAIILNTPVDFFLDTMSLRELKEHQLSKIELLSKLKKELNSFPDL